MEYIADRIPLWQVTTWDKNFNNVDKSWQPKTIKYNYLLSDELDEIRVDDGDVRILYTGKDVGYTTEELAGDNISEGEIVSIPWGGIPTVKYYKGKFVTGDNRIATSNDTSKLSNRYLYYFMKGHIHEIASYYRGASLKHPCMKDVLKMEISYPTLEVQNRICDQFDVIDAVIEQRYKELSLFDELIKARFVELFGDVITNDRGWAQQIFEDITESRLGKMLDAKKQTGEHAYPYLANFNVQWFTFNTDNLNEMDFDEKDRKEFELQEGDLLVCEGGEIGRCAIWHNEIQPCYFQKALHRVRCKKEYVIPEYLAWWFKYNCEHGGFSAIEGAKATISHLPGAKLKKLNVTVPEMKRQEEFAVFIDQVDKSKVAVQKSLDETQRLFDSLMQEYFG